MSLEKLEEQVSNQKLEILTIKKTLENTVSYKQYTWTLGILILIVMGIFAYIATRMDQVSSRIDQLTSATASIQSDVSYLKGKLAPYDVQYKN